MKEYYAQIVYAIDIALVGLTFALSIMIVTYALIKSIFERARYNRLSNIISGLQKLALEDSREMISGCSILIKDTSPFELLDVIKQGQIPPDKFVQQFSECVTNSGKVAEAEEMAQRPDDKWRRIEAIIIIGYFKSPNALEILKKSLLDLDEDVVYFSLLSLGYIKNQGSASLLLSAIKKRTFNSQKIASILEQFPPDVVETLISNIDDEDPVLRFWVIKLLSIFKPDQYAIKIGSFADDPSPDIRAAVCECLGQIGQNNTLDVIRRHLTDEKWVVRMYALRALENIMGEGSIRDIAPLIHDSHWFIKESVKEIMIKHYVAAIKFIEELLSDKDPDARQSAIEIMDKSGYSNQILDDVLSDDGEVRKRGQRWLEALVKAGAHFGLEGILSRYPGTARERIFDAIAAIDKGVADHMRGKIIGINAET